MKCAAAWRTAARAALGSLLLPAVAAAALASGSGTGPAAQAGAAAAPAQRAPRQMQRNDPWTAMLTAPRRIIDLSYAISDKLPAWPGDKRSFEAHEYANAERDGYFTRSFWMLEHFGTHLDAPIHFPPGKRTVDQIPPERLFGPAVVIDVREEAAKDADYRLAVSRVSGWEKRHGRIPQGAVVVLRTGWAARWNQPGAYVNTDRKGTMHFPGYSVEAVRIFIQRGVSGLAIDTMSVDPGVSSTYEVHKLSHGADLYHVENLSDLGELPEAGAFLVVAPIKLEGGSGGACRVLAILP